MFKLFTNFRPSNDPYFKVLEKYEDKPITFFYDYIPQNINELNNLDICDIRDSRDSHEIIDSAETSDNSDVDYSLDGEEYIIIDRSIQ
jgi:hypothetical protein